MYIKIAEDVYDITCKVEESGKRYRVFLITSGVPTLMDAGLEGTVSNVKETIAEIGTDPERLIVTHGDQDHIGGFDALSEAYDVETWIPKKTTADIGRDPDRRYGDGDKIGRYVGINVPGHTPDNHVLVDEEAGIAVMGDAVSGSDQRGLPPGHFHLPPAVYSQDLNLAEESLERVLDYHFDVALTFHGSSITENAAEKLERYVNFPGIPR